MINILFQQYFSHIRMMKGCIIMKGFVKCKASYVQQESHLLLKTSHLICLAIQMFLFSGGFSLILIAFQSFKWSWCRCVRRADLAAFSIAFQSHFSAPNTKGSDHKKTKQVNSCRAMKVDLFQYFRWESNLRLPVFWVSTCPTTVNFLNIRTPKKFVVITLKFELCGSIIE